MAPRPTTSAAALEHVWGALVDLLKALTRIANGVADQADADKAKKQA